MGIGCEIYCCGVVRSVSDCRRYPHGARRRTHCAIEQDMAVDRHYFRGGERVAFLAGGIGVERWKGVER